MSVADWRVIYRGYSAAELDAEIESLRKGAKGGFSAQASGSVSHQRDTSELRDRLRAAQEVKTERGESSARGTKSDRRGVVDFGNTGYSDF